jgi:hypothetical protein
MDSDHHLQIARNKIFELKGEVEDLNNQLHEIKEKEILRDRELQELYT